MVLPLEQPGKKVETSCDQMKAQKVPVLIFAFTDLSHSSDDDSLTIQLLF